MSVLTIPCLVALVFCVSVTVTIDVQEEEAKQLVDDVNQLGDIIKKDVSLKVSLRDHDDNHVEKYDPFKGNFSPFYKNFKGLRLRGKFEHDFGKGLKVGGQGEISEIGGYKARGHIIKGFGKGLKTEELGEISNLGGDLGAVPISKDFSNGVKTGEHVTGHQHQHGDSRIGFHISKPFE